MVRILFSSAIRVCPQGNALTCDRHTPLRKGMPNMRFLYYENRTPLFFLLLVPGLALFLASVPVLFSAPSDARTPVNTSNEINTNTVNKIPTEGPSQGPFASDDQPERKNFVVITGDVTIAPTDIVGTVIVLRGAVAIHGTALDIYVFDGDVEITGIVHGNLLALNGHITLHETAEVSGDLLFSEIPTVAVGAKIGGTRQRLDSRWIAEQVDRPLRQGIWGAAGISTLVLGFLLILCAPRGADAVAGVRHTGFLRLFCIGAITGLGIPALAFVALRSLLSAPFGIALLASLALFYAIGYTAGAWALGRLLFKRKNHHYIPFLIGLGLLRAGALFPSPAIFLWPVASLYGLGSITVAIWKTRKPLSSQQVDRETEKETQPSPTPILPLRTAKNYSEAQTATVLSIPPIDLSTPAAPPNSPTTGWHPLVTVKTQKSPQSLAKNSTEAETVSLEDNSLSDIILQQRETP